MLWQALTAARGLDRLLDSAANRLMVGSLSLLLSTWKSDRADRE